MITLTDEKYQEIEQTLEGMYNHIVTLTKKIEEQNELLTPSQTIELEKYQEFIDKVELEREMTDAVADLTDLQDEVNQV